MGSTCASFHILWRGSAADAAKAISRAYVKLGYERAKTRPAEGGKHVIVSARASDPFVSVYDSENADLDSGELKDAAMAASKTLKTAAVFTSLYDSDTYEFIIFGNGRQVDLLISDMESYGGPLKRLAGKARATQWSKIFARPLAPGQIEHAANPRAVFADATLAEIGALVGLAGARSQKHYRDFEGEPDSVTTEFYFKKTAAAPMLAPGRVLLRNYYDPDNSRKLLVHPAAWPMPLDREELLTWLILSEGDGFAGATATVEVQGPEGLTIARGFANGANFHNGQIVGGYELAKGATAEEGQAYLETKRFPLTLAEPAAGELRVYRADMPNLRIPAMTPQRSTQILLVLQLYVTASRGGEWEVKVELRPRSLDGYVHRLPGARVAALEQRWLPVVSGLNPKTVYDTSDIVEPPAPDNVIDRSIPQSPDPRHRAPPSAEARAEIRERLAQGRERNHKLWRQELAYQQARARNELRLEYPAVLSCVAILRDGAQSTLDVCRPLLEDWLRPFAAGGGEVRLHAEKQMTDAFYVGKTKKIWPAAAVLDDKAWAKLFDAASNYQSVRVDFVPSGGEIPIGGMGFGSSLRHGRPARDQSGDAEQAREAANESLMAMTLGKMRARAPSEMVSGDTRQVYLWVIAHDACTRALSTSADAMKAKWDAFAGRCPPLQAWHGAWTWIPAFDRADSYEATIYEDMSALNFFRGVLLEQVCALKERRMTARWCGAVLRMVAPRMWLCRDLVEQLDMAALERVATVSRFGETYGIVKHPDRAMDDLELALLPILPIENARITLVGD